MIYYSSIQIQAPAIVNLNSSFIEKNSTSYIHVSYIIHYTLFKFILSCSCSVLFLRRFKCNNTVVVQQLCRFTTCHLIYLQ